MSKAVRMIRVLAYANGRNTVYNDRLKDGKRSVKVVGWKRKDYECSLELLRMAGLDGRIRKVNNGYSQDVHRIWIG